MYFATKKKIHGLLHPEIVGDKNWDKVINIFIITLIILNVAAVMLETVPVLTDTYEKRRFFHYFELVSVIIFTIEYLLRVWSSNHDPKFSHSLHGRLKYMITSGALIDLIAILPFYVHVIIGLDLRVLRMLRLIRVFRLIRLTAYTKASHVVFSIFKSRKSELTLAFILTLFLIVIASCLVYFAEHNAQPDKFTSIPHTIWWAVVSLTTVGYGDMIPITLLGKTFAIIVLLAGVAMLAIPAGIITAGFLEESRKLRKAHEKGKHCPHCGKLLPAGDDSDS